MVYKSRNNHKTKTSESGNISDFNRNNRAIVILVMGPTGAGKSTFINAALGQNRMTVGKEIESCTTDIACADIGDLKTLFPQLPVLLGRRVLLVDTPGFDDTYQDDVVILERIAKWLKDSYRTHEIGGIIYLHDISIDRYTGSTKKNLILFNRLCGEGALDKVVLGTTKANRLSPGEEKKRLCSLKDFHWKDMISHQALVVPFDGHRDSALNLVNTVLSRFGVSIPLEIQRERVNQVQRELVNDITSMISKWILDLMSKFLGQRKDSRYARDIVIFVMGSTGAGKSTFINTVLGKNTMAVGMEIESCTLNIATAQVDTSKFPLSSKLQGRRMVLVDTPGFDNTYISDNSEILEKIAKWLKNSSHKDALGGVIYLHDISVDRYTNTARKNLSMFSRLIGGTGFRKVVLGTTKASKLLQDEATKRSSRLKDFHWKDMIDMGALILPFDEDRTSALRIVEAILTCITA